MGNIYVSSAGGGVLWDAALKIAASASILPAPGSALAAYKKCWIIKLSNVILISDIIRIVKNLDRYLSTNENGSMKNCSTSILEWYCRLNSFFHWT